MAETAQTEFFSEVELGKTYADRITGFEGVATQVVFTIEGYTRVLIETSPSKVNELGASEWFSEDRVRRA